MDAIRFSLLAVLVFGLCGIFAEEANADHSSMWGYGCWGAPPTDSSYPLDISANGEYIVASCEQKLHFFNKTCTNSNSVGYCSSQEPLWSRSIGSILSVAISADGQYISASGDGIHLYDLEGNYLWSHETEDWVYSVATSADGNYIAAAATNNVYLFHKDSNTPLLNYTTGSNVKSIVISADGQYIAVGSNGEGIYLFNKDSNTPLWSYDTVGGNNTSSVAISADGNYIAVGSEDNNTYLFHKDSGTPLWSYETGAGVNSVAISADGQYITAGSNDSKLYLFDKDSNEPLWSYERESFYSCYVSSVDISADGEYITAGFDSPGWCDGIYFFDKDSNVPLWAYMYDRAMTSVAISADGEYIIAKTYEGGLFLFDSNTKPVAVIDSVTPSSECCNSQIFIGDEITFNGSGYDLDGTIEEYMWYDNSSSENESCWLISSGYWDDDLCIPLSTERNFSISNLSFGTYDIHFSVKDNEDAWGTRDWYVHVCGMPVALASHWNDANSIKTGNSVEFRGNGTDEDGEIVLYEWDFNGDGIYDWSSDETGSTNYTYDSAGTYTAVLRVTDSAVPGSNCSGFTATDSRTIIVSEDGDNTDGTPVAIAGNDATVETGDTVQFSGAGTDDDGEIVLFEWDFDGDGVFEWSSEENGITTFIYNTEGTYTTVLRVTDNSDFTATDSRTITVTKDSSDDGNDNGDDDGNDDGDDDGFIPAPSLIAALGVLLAVARRRR